MAEEDPSKAAHYPDIPKYTAPIIDRTMLYMDGGIKEGVLYSISQIYRTKTDLAQNENDHGNGRFNKREREKLRADLDTAGLTDEKIDRVLMQIGEDLDQVWRKNHELPHPHAAVPEDVEKKINALEGWNPDKQGNFMQFKTKDKAIEALKEAILPIYTGRDQFNTIEERNFKRDSIVSFGFPKAAADDLVNYIGEGLEKKEQERASALDPKATGNKMDAIKGEVAKAYGAMKNMVIDFGERKTIDAPAGGGLKAPHEIV